MFWILLILLVLILAGGFAVHWVWLFIVVLIIFALFFRVW